MAWTTIVRGQALLGVVDRDGAAFVQRGLVSKKGYVLGLVMATERIGGADLWQIGGHGWIGWTKADEHGRWWRDRCRIGRAGDEFTCEA